MKHSAPRPRVRWVRSLVAGLSSLTVGFSLLGAAGALSFSPPPDRAVTIGAGDDTRAERAFDAAAAGTTERPEAPAGDPEPSASAPPTPKTKPRKSPRSREPDSSRASERATVSPSAPTPPPDPTKQPVSFFDQPLDLPPDSGSGRRIVFSISKQYVWLVAADNSIERRYPVSGSRFDQLEPGTYEVIRKRRHTTSWHGTESLEYMVTFTFGENAAIGFHDIPRDLATGKLIQTVDQLGMALSDGCVRQRHQDAAALWDFAPVGTPVIVLE